MISGKKIAIAQIILLPNWQTTTSVAIACVAFWHTSVPNPPLQDVFLAPPQSTSLVNSPKAISIFSH
ncbi:hypothetical protein OGM63_07225 [Plectonema radiosum NIES-515]|uniref:Uncharacterized protein n=1 Tax=Plectonema radiosum NIES-515 TaxID=2986073 RepID=A0ABT3AW26_9CYAN|nr:hypothetical protein [Plectonema radiosum]MCV3213316.1 hypothetical protein [Plectonema radiosum NIES-515]